MRLARSEEHTSELQSLRHLVCRLLLECVCHHRALHSFPTRRSSDLFAAFVLGAILAAGFDVPLVLTQPDRPRGRGLKLEPSPVKQLALDHSLPVLQPATLRSDEACEIGRAHV